MIDCGNDLTRFARLCRRMGGSTDVSFGSPTNTGVGGRYVSNNEMPHVGLKAGDTLDVYAQFSGDEAEYNVLKASNPGLERGAKVTVTCGMEGFSLLALTGCVPNDFGSYDPHGDLKDLAKNVQRALPRPSPEPK